MSKNEAPVNAMRTDALISETFNSTFTEFDVNTERVIDLLVQSQNGSLSIALIELISNSQDAGATRIDITLSPSMFRITDNGKGFTSKDDILTKFKTLGDGVDVHEDTNIGRFHIGRSQIFSHAKCKWKSHQFEMHVDYKDRIGFNLIEGASHVDGCVVEGSFYNKISQYAITEAIREIEKNVKLMRSEVYINGILSNKAVENWDYEDEVLKLKLDTEGDGIAIYSNGVFVKTIPHHQYAMSGTILTKKRLALNLARNQTNDYDPVWKHIQAVLREEGKRRSSKTKTTPTQKRMFAISSFKRGEFDMDLVGNAKIFRDICGKYLTLSQLLSNHTVLSGNSSSSETEASIAEAATREGSFLFFHSSTYSEWGVSTPRDLMRMVSESLKLMVAKLGDSYLKHTPERFVTLISENITYSDSTKVAEIVSTASKIYTDKELTKLERSRRSALQAACDAVADSLRKRKRKLHFGEKPHTNGFTDSHTYIAIDINHGRNCLKSESALMYCITLIIHEFSHDSENVTTDAHDLDFYESFHDSVRHTDAITYAASKARKYVRRNFGKLGFKKPSWMKIKEEDFIFKLQNSSALTTQQTSLLEAMNVTITSNGKTAEISVPIKSLKIPTPKAINKILGEKVALTDSEIDDSLAEVGIYTQKNYHLDADYRKAYDKKESENTEQWLEKMGLKMPYSGFTIDNIYRRNDKINEGASNSVREMHPAIIFVCNIIDMFPNTKSFSSIMSVPTPFYGNSEMLKNGNEFSCSHNRMERPPTDKVVSDFIKNGQEEFRSALNGLLANYSGDARKAMFDMLENKDFIDSLK